MSIFDSVRHHTHYIVHSWQILSGNWIIAFVNKFVVLFFLVSLVLIFWRWSLLPPKVPLWYSRPWGADQLAQPAFLFILPFGGLLWYSIDLLLATYVTRDYLVFTQTLFLSSFIINLLALVTLTKILFLVT